MSDWNNKVKRILKAELVKRGLSTEDLTTLLNNDGCNETKSSVDSKISRGTFSASFFLHSLYVIGCTKLEIEEFQNMIRITNDKLPLVAEDEIEYKKKDDEK
ncbi:DUF6471 domain-containing protein [Chishuiella sp.]|uniref:DUF6471 domain-containing protein n=1 Tax=Chishuiella sp. TaxID=1969467 RepID=UPI0028AABF45|nr:DUF6471 domain-containing protein [Chishuiella sp.]